MKLSKSSRTRLSVLFLVFFVLENIWLVQHSGPVLWISEFSVRHLGYWSSRLSYGLPIVFGVLLFIVLVIVLFAKGILFLEDETGRPVKEKPTMNDFRLFWERTKVQLSAFRFPVVMIVIGLEFSALAVIKFYEAKSFGPLVECGLQSLSEHTCGSRWVRLPQVTADSRVQVEIEKSSKLFSYIQLDPKWPVYLKHESYRTEEAVNVMSQLAGQPVEGIVEDIDYSHFVFFKHQGIETPAREIQVISWKENPSSFSFMATVQFIIGFLFTLIGSVSFKRRSKKVLAQN